ncbi:HEPACAM family member 2-like isoform X1 [Salvelinus sp. IW2-2015]|uniref:HEPACAM family member 2-like isoform X1 n=1 Tax=Salvelinus sp. IW2-2015 TaxID=2691554 RepID=UPI000CDF817C|nr:HEPACAM family member 2-like isoform X1 [Salvelinus alpinus]
MEAPGRRTFVALCFYTAILTLSEVNSEFVHVPSVLNGVKGKSLLLSVETYFRLEDVEIQGSWYQTRPGGPKTLLVTFHNHSAIMVASMRHRNRFFFQPPNASLLIPRLDEAAEGGYHLDLDIHFPQRQEFVRVERTIHVTVDVPVSTPVIRKTPSSTVVEDKENVTWTCWVENGTRVQYQWLRNNMPLDASDCHQFSQDNSTLVISPVRKKDIGQYRCLAKNHISQRQSHTLDLNVFYGPYNLAVKSDHGLRTGEVFTVNPGELVFFDCQADSNPPNSCMWISKTNNATEVITVGLRLEVTSYKLAQAEEFLCRAFNNVTQKQDETQFTLVVASLGTGKERYVQESNSFSPLAAITLSCLFITGCMLLAYFIKTCHHPKRVLMNIYNRPLTEPKRPHCSGHEDATEDFGIYEFVSIPGKMESTQASSRSLAHLESVQDLHTTIYDVIRHIPETPTLANQSLLLKQWEA